MYTIYIKRKLNILSKADLKRSLAIKDLNNISDKSWNRMRIDLNLKNNIPPLNQMINHRKSLKTGMSIKINKYGVYISIKKKDRVKLKNK